MGYNVSAMVSREIKSSELSIKHLAKTFYFVLCLWFHFITFDSIVYSHCWQIVFFNLFVELY